MSSTGRVVCDPPYRGYSSLTEKLQSERDRLERQVAERDTRITELATLHAADQSEIARLRIDIDRLGGAR